MNQQTISLTPYFLEAFSKLSKQDQHRVHQAILKVSRNKNSPGLRSHTISEKTGQFISLSAGMDLRILSVPYNDSLALVYVDHHDAAYLWGRNHKVLINEKEALFELIHLSEATQKQEKLRIKPQFGMMVAAKLEKSNLSKEILEQIQNAENEDDLLLIFEKRKSINQTKPNGYPVDMQTIGFVRSVFVQYLCKHSIAARICHGVLFLQCVPSFASR